MIWVQFLKWQQKLEAHKGKTIWRKKVWSMVVINTYMRNLDLDFLYAAT